MAGFFASFSLLAEGDKKVDFAKEIQPILQKSCLPCHGAEKHKGDLRLNSKEAALKGGKNNPAFVVGKADKSEMFRRIILPAGHDDVMPSKGDLLTKAQTDLIRDWINQGANWPEGVIQEIAGNTIADDKVEAPKLADIKPTPAELKVVAALQAAGVPIRPIAMNVNWKEANFRGLQTNATDASIAPLKEVLSLMDLNLAGTKITDAGLANLEGLTNLARLHLEHTKITDAGLSHFKSLSNLVYLNLFDTPISDAGLAHLQGLSKLKNLYLWQTKVTDAGVTNLQKQLPDLKIHQGWNLTPVAKKEEPTKKEEPKK